MDNLKDHFPSGSKEFINLKTYTTTDTSTEYVNIGEYSDFFKGYCYVLSGTYLYKKSQTDFSTIKSITVPTDARGRYFLNDKILLIYSDKILIYDVNLNLLNTIMTSISSNILDWVVIDNMAYGTTANKLYKVNSNGEITEITIPFTGTDIVSLSTISDLYTYNGKLFKCCIKKYSTSYTYCILVLDTMGNIEKSCPGWSVSSLSYTHGSSQYYGNVIYLASYYLNLNTLESTYQTSPFSSGVSKYLAHCKNFTVLAYGSEYSIKIFSNKLQCIYSFYVPFGLNLDNSTMLVKKFTNAEIIIYFGSKKSITIHSK